jgi:hypothetical protein
MDFQGNWDYSRAKLVKRLAFSTKSMHEERHELRRSAHSQHQFAFHCCLSIVIGDKGRLERAVVVDVFNDVDDGFGAQTVPQRVSPGSLFAVLGLGAGALL